mmetsp:Transcript_11501/g.14326  ORF Transcript_11501/g.14326 Transcript_11501/m.14326 type:complete len:169 (+) Transcript_11501:266-772(+)|eukprot:CAMPEP_0204843964 /NCGR_PEP_ID=MMETSP1346-20131115/48283_1 /ASSEMBLY_ACC=CAM_ASM_000771 /TAXON_ID=215587 /ORGANISM="Aplanochytrium stocchinoi, Strain GSBS06" /LENGTH=168 /DNA_ID=CAMNT_0051983189 /DNA_START=647 /DNA_END=1153 /DNA_ORIENTATION=-
MDGAGEVAVETQAKAQNALQHNIASKGQNAYYYAHSKSRDSVYNFGGKPEKLESLKTSKVNANKTRVQAIKKYSWADGKKTVKIYIEKEGLDDLPEHQIELTCEEKSFCLLLKEPEKDQNSSALHHELRLPKLHDEVKKATFKRKEGNRLIISLFKERECTWYQLQEK